MKKNRLTFLALAIVAPVLLFVGLVTAVFPPTAHAASEITVTTLIDENDGCGAGDGCSLREAIAAVDPGGTIEFDVSGTIVLGSELVIDKNLTIDGGNEITVSGNNTTRVFNVTAGNVTLDSLTIVNGYTPNDGGGIRNGSTLTVNNSTLSGNSAENGGGLYNNAPGPVQLTNVLFSGNSSNNHGGGMYNHGSSPILTGVIFSDNHAHATSGWGGAYPIIITAVRS